MFMLTWNFKIKQFASIHGRTNIITIISGFINFAALHVYRFQDGVGLLLFVILCWVGQVVLESWLRLCTLHPVSRVKLC